MSLTQMDSGHGHDHYQHCHQNSMRAVEPDPGSPRASGPTSQLLLPYQPGSTVGTKLPPDPLGAHLALTFRLGEEAGRAEARRPE